MSSFAARRALHNATRRMTSVAPIARTATTIPSRPAATAIFCSAAQFSSSAIARHDHLTPPEPGKGIKVTFTDSKGNDIKTVEGKEGDDLLSLAHEYDIDLEGACERSVACSTCHVILDPEIFDKLPEADDEENDMLDLAFGLEDTSRLGCQVLLTPDLNGMRAKIPSATRNMFVDGKKPVRH